MQEQQAFFQDWPGVGQFIDQHILHNQRAMAAEGRATPKTLLSMQLHRTKQDERGNSWLLIPKSNLKVDWRASHNKRTKKFKPRNPVPLVPDALEAFIQATLATTAGAVQTALQTLGICAEDGSVNWELCAKTFDDWNLVLTGPLTDELWVQRTMPLPQPEERNKHMLYLCFNCAVAARWGPCEHAYSFMLERGDINSCQVPQPKPKGRPRTPACKPASCPRSLVPAQATPVHEAAKAPPLVAPLTDDQKHLKAVLQQAGCGRYFPAMLAQKASLAILSRCALSDYCNIFKMQLPEAFQLMQARGFGLGLSKRLARFVCLAGNFLLQVIFLHTSVCTSLASRPCRPKTWAAMQHLPPLRHVLRVFVRIPRAERLRYIIMVFISPHIPGLPKFDETSVSVAISVPNVNHLIH